MGSQMTAQIEALYRKHVLANTAISPHLHHLRDLANGLDHAVEFGVKRGASSCALLLGAKQVTSYDIAATKEALALKAIAGDRWDYRIEDSRLADVPECDLLFIDSLHTFYQVQTELAAHGNKARKFLVFHDVTTFGEVGAVGETGRQSWTYAAGRGSVPDEHRGIRPAIDFFQIANPHWRIYSRYVESHGLLVLRRTLA